MFRLYIGILSIIFISCASPRNNQEYNEQVIFDTDTAYLNDDGLALAMLLNHKDKIQIKGITIIPGNEWPEQGVEYMFRTLELMNSTEIPVYMGSSKPLVQNKDRAQAHMSLIPKKDVGWLGAFNLPRHTHRSKMRKPYLGFTDLQPKKENAIDFMIKSIENNPHKITILALGPLTNIALLIQKRPDLISKIKRLIIMGGSLYAKGNTTKHAEFNFWFDPEAAKITLESNIKEKVIFGLDITNQAIITRKRFFNIIHQKNQTPLMKYYEHALGYQYPKFISNPKRESTYVWDVLPALYLINKRIVQSFEKTHISVYDFFDGKSERSQRYGQMIKKKILRGEKKMKTKVALKLNEQLFHRLYKRELTSEKVFH